MTLKRFILQIGYLFKGSISAVCTRCSACLITTITITLRYGMSHYVSLFAISPSKKHGGGCSEVNFYLCKLIISWKGENGKSINSEG